MTNTTQPQYKSISLKASDYEELAEWAERVSKKTGMTVSVPQAIMAAVRTVQATEPKDGSNV